MSQFIDQFFDVHFMSQHFDQVLAGFGTTMLLWVVSGVLALIWGLVLAVLRQVPGRAGAFSRSDDRLHRRLPGHSPADGRGADLRRLRGALVGQRDPRADPRVDRGSDLVRQAVGLLVRHDGAGDHLRRLHGGGLPGGDRGGAQGADRGGAVARDEPRSDDAVRDRPAGDPESDPAASQRSDRADEGHLAGQLHLAERGSAGRVRPAVEDVQQLGAHPRSDLLPDRDDPAGAGRRLADRRDQRKTSRGGRPAPTTEPVAAGTGLGGPT